MVQEASGLVMTDEVAVALFNAPVGDGIDRALVSAVAWDESSFRADAVGAAGEVGLMQLSEVALRDVERLRDRVGAIGFEADSTRRGNPRYSVQAGTWYLRILNTVYMDAYRQQLSEVAWDREMLILAWYKGGPGRITPEGIQLARRARERAETIRRLEEEWQTRARG